MQRSIIAIAGATAALSLAACGGVTEAADSPDSTTPSSSSSNDWTPEPYEDEAPAPTPDAPTVLGFGDEWKYEDGMSVKVTEPATFTPGEYSAGGEGFPSHVRFDITLTNNTSAAFDPTLAMDSVVSGGVEGDAVFDDGLEGSPMSTLLPGKSVTYSVGYGVQDATDVQIEVVPSWDHEPALFTADGGEQA